MNMDEVCEIEQRNMGNRAADIFQMELVYTIIQLRLTLLKSRPSFFCTIALQRLLRVVTLSQ